MYIPKRKVVCAMITEIDFKVKGEERKKLAYAIGELLGMKRIFNFDTAATL